MQKNGSPWPGSKALSMYRPFKIFRPLHHSRFNTQAWGCYVIDNHGNLMSIFFFKTLFIRVFSGRIHYIMAIHPWKYYGRIMAKLLNLQCPSQYFLYTPLLHCGKLAFNGILWHTKALCDEYGTLRHSMMGHGALCQIMSNYGIWYFVIHQNFGMP